MKGTGMAFPCSLMLVFVLLLVPGNAFSSSTPSYNYHGEQTTKSQDEDTNYWPATHQAVGAQHCEQHEWKDTCISPYLNKIQPLVIAPCHKRNFTDELCKDFKNILDCVTGYNISQSCIVVSLSAHFHHLGVHFGNEDFECMMSDFNNSCLNTLPAKSSTFLWRNITGDTPFRNLSSKGDTPFANTSTTVETVFGSYSTMNGNGNHENTSLPKAMNVSNNMSTRERDTPFRNLSSKGDTPSANTSTTVETVSRSYSTMNGNGNHENTSLPKVKTVSTTASTIHVRTVSTTESTSKGKIGSTTASTINGDTPPKTTSPTVKTVSATQSKTKKDTPPKTTSSTEDTAPKTTSSTVRTTSTTESTTKVKTVTTTASGTNGNSIFTTIPSSNGYSILTNTPSSNGNDIHTTPSSNAKVTTTTLLSNRKAIPKITPSSKGKKSVAVTRAYLALILVLTILPMFVFM